MVKTVNLLVNTGKEETSQLFNVKLGSGKKAAPTRVQAVKGARYQLQEQEGQSRDKDVGPDQIRIKRVGNHLHIFLVPGTEADLIIEGYYQEGMLVEPNTGIFGRAESGQLYEYIPEDPRLTGLSANLIEGATPVSQVLGGGAVADVFALSGFSIFAASAFNAVAMGAGLIGLAALGGKGGVTPAAAAPSGQTGALDERSDSAAKGDQLTNVKSPTITGHATQGASVRVDINDANGQVVHSYNTTADSNGNYSVSVPKTNGLSDGRYTPFITVSNGSGSTTAAGAPFVIDTATNGTGGLTHNSVNDTGSSSSDSITNNSKPTFSGTGEPGATVKVNVDGQTLTAVVGTDGRWITRAADYAGTGLSGGQHAVQIEFTDKAGNSKTITADPVRVSTSAGNVTLTVDAVTPDNTLNASEVNAVGNTTITGQVSGDFTAGDVVSLTINGSTFTGAVNASGAYSIAVPTAALAADAGKTIAASVAVHDTAGNPATVSTSHVYLVDTTGPSASTTTLVVHPVTTDNMLNATEAGATTIAITGQVNGDFTAGDMVTLTINGNTYTGAVAANGSYSIDVASADLVSDADKTIEASVQAHDTANNAGTVSVQHSYIYDNTGPSNTTTSVSVNVVAGDDIVNSTEANQTNTHITGTVSGEFTAGDTVSVLVNGHTFTGAVAANGTYAIDLSTADVLADADHTLDVSLAAHDAAGNPGSVSATRRYGVDTTGPNSTTTSLRVDVVTADNTLNVTEGTASQTAITGAVSGEYKTGDVVTLTVNGQTFSGAVNAQGAYNINVTTSDLLADADKTIQASIIAHDAAGNPGAITATRLYLVDQTGPDANTTDLVVDTVTVDNVVNIVESAQNPTTITGRVTGEFTVGDVVTFTVNGHTFTGTVANDGTYSIAVTTADLLADADKVIDASLIAHDSTGNPGTISSTRSYTIDNTTPNGNTTAIHIDPLTPDNIINATESGVLTTAVTGKVTGQFTVGDVVTLSIHGVDYTGTVDAVGAFSISVPTAELLADTDTTIDATVAAHNTAQNLGSASATHTYGVDTTLPSDASTSLTLNAVTADNTLNTTESGLSTTNVSGKVSGEFKAGDVVTLTINNHTFTGSVAADGTFTIATTTADLLADNDKTIAATVAAHDAADNVANIAATHAYLIDTTAPDANTTHLVVDQVTADNILNTTEAGAQTTAITGSVTGEFKAGDTVTLTVNGHTFTGTVNAQGGYSIDVATADLIADADKTIDATIDAHDPANNLATVTGQSRTYVVDTAAPNTGSTTLSIATVTSDDIINATESGAATIAITGAASGEFKTGDVVTLTVNGQTVSGAVDAQGAYSINVTTSDLLADADKTITATLVAHDSANNAGNITATHTYVVDTQAPNSTTTTLTIDPITADNIVNHQEASQTNVTVTGRVDGDFTVGDTVTLTANGHNYTGQVLANGTYSIDVLSADLVADTGKTLAGKVAAHDKANNIGNITAQHSYAVDTSVPNNGAALGLTIDTDANNDGTITYAELAGAQTFSVTATFDKTLVSVGDVITFTPSVGTATTVVLTQTIIDAGQASTTFTSISTGTFSVSAVMSDSAHNATTPATDSAAVDLTNPNTSVSVAITGMTTDSGVDASDYITNDNTLTYSGTATGYVANGDKIKLELLAANGTTVVATDYVTPTGNNWTWAYQTTQADGQYTLRATLVDVLDARVNTAAGGQATQVLVIDTQGSTDQPSNTPSANANATVSIDLISDDSGMGSNDFITNDNTLVYKGTVAGFTANGDVIKLELLAADGTTVLATHYVTPTITSGTDGNWAWDRSALTPEADGQYTLRATVVDVADNRINTAAAGQDTQVVIIDTDAGHNQPNNVVDPNTAATVGISTIHNPSNGSTDSGVSSTDFVTNDNTLIIEGTVNGFNATTGGKGDKVLVQIVDSNNTVVAKQYVTPDTADHWAMDNQAIALADGTYTIKTFIVDIAGNTVATGATQALVIDTNKGGTQPDDPNTSATITLGGITSDTGYSGSDYITSDGSLIISGTVGNFSNTGNAAGDKVRVQVLDAANQVVAEQYLDPTGANGTWAFDNQAHTLPDGTYTIKAAIVDKAGNPVQSAPDQTLVIDNFAAPTNATVAISAISADTGISTVDFITSDNTLVFNGTTASFDASANKVKVQIIKTSDNSVIEGYATVANDGTWSLDKTGTTLADGEYTIRAVLTNLAGTAEVAGTATTHSLVVDHSGSVNQPNNQTDPNTNVVVSITTIHDVDAGSIDSGASSTDFITNDSTLVIKGSLNTFDAATGDKLWVQIVDATQAVVAQAYVTPDGTGHWAMDNTAVVLPDGSYTIQAVVVDIAGNPVNTQATHSLVVDTNKGGTDPNSSATISIDGITTDSGYSDADFITSDGTLSIRGSVTGFSNTGLNAGSKVHVQVFNNAGQVVAEQYLDPTGPSGTWNFDNQAHALVDGDYTIKAAIVDAAGNPIAAQAQEPLVINSGNTPTQATLAISSISDDTGVSTSDFVTSDTTLTITGTTQGYAASSGDQIWVQIIKVSDSSVVTSGYATLANATWQYNAATLPSDKYTIRAVYTTAAGVENSQPVTHSLVVDNSGITNPANNPNTDPNALATTSIVSMSDDTGVSTTDYITTDNTLAIHGSTTNFSTAAGGAGDMVHVVLSGNGVNVDQYIATDAQGNWTLDNTANTLADGTYTLTATLVDQAGNRLNSAAGGSATQNITVAHAANPSNPNLSATVNITAISTDSGASSTDFVTTDHTLIISGTVSAFTANGDQVRLDIVDSNNTVIKTVYVTPTGSTWSVDNQASYLLDGTYTLKATIVDVAGNPIKVGPTQQLVIDNVVPTQTVTISAIEDNEGSVTGDVASGGTTDDTRLNLRGALSIALGAGEVVQVFDNGTYIGNAVASGTNWTFVDPRTLSNGQAVSYTAQVVDLAGNPGSASSPYTATVNTNVPTLTIGNIAGDTVNDSSTLNGTYDGAERGALPTTVTTRPVVSGTSTYLDGQTISVTVNNINYTTVVQTGGAWSVTLSTGGTDADAVALNHGNTYQVFVSGLSVGGKLATDTNNSLVINTAQADVPTVQNQYASTTTPTLAGLAQKFDPSNPSTLMALEVGDTLQVTVNGVTITGAIGSLPAGLGYDAATRTWSLNTSSAGSFNLQTGQSYDVAVQVTTGNGTVTKNDVSSAELVINTTPPTITLNTISSDGYLNAAEAGQSLVITGVTTAQVGATVTITGLDGSTRTAQVLAGTGGNNTFMLTIAASDVAAFATTNSTKTVHAAVTNQFGLSGSDDKNLVIDIGVPTAVADTVTVDENHVVAGSGNVSGNDTGVDSTDVYALVGANGSGNISGTYVAIHMNSNGSYTLAPNTANVHGITADVVETFTYKVTDAAGNSTTATLAITVTPVNTAPTNTVPTAQSTNEDTAKVISGLSIADVDAANSSVTVTLAVGHGTISLLTGTGVTLGTNGTASVTLSGTVTDINALLATANAVTYTPSLNYNGSDTLTMTTNDGGNTGAGGALSDTDTVAITVNAVNDAPVNTVPTAQTTDEDTAKVISGLSIADVDAANSSVTVTLAVGHGTISVATGTGVTLGTNGTASVTLTGTVSDINALLATANAVTYTPSANYNGSDTFTMTTNDGGNTGAGGALSDTDTVSITVNAVNDAPVNTVPTAQSTDEDTAKVISGLSIADDAVGNVVVTLAVGHGTMSVAAGAGVTLGGNGTASVTLTGTVSAINSLLTTANAVTYTPSANYNGSDTLTMTTSDGVLTDTDTVALTVNPVNDRPVPTGVNTSTTEEVGYTWQVSSLLAGKVADADAGASVLGMFIQFVSAQYTNAQGNLQATNGGTWEYSADGSTNWTSVPSAILAGNSPASAMFVSLSAYLRYTPAANYNGVIDVYFRVVDNSMPTTVTDAVSGASVTLQNGVRVNTVTTANLASDSPISYAGVWRHTVSAVNDAPVLNTATVVTMPTQTEDAAVPTGATAGALVSDLFGAISDVDVAALQGIAITGVNGNGTLYYSTNDGTTWAAATGTLSDSSALLLTGANRVYFKPNANWSGTIANAFLYRAWDQTNGGTAGMRVAIGNSGGSSGYSADYSQVGITVTGVNDAPVGVADTAAATEAGGTSNGTAGTSPSGNVLTNDIDVDTGDTKVVQDIRTGTAGTITAVSAGTTSANGLSLAGTYGTIKIGADGSYVYTVDNANATVQALNTGSTALTDTFTYTVKDAAGLTSTATITVLVNGANDAPVNTVPGAQTTDEDTAKVITGLSIADVDAGTGTGNMTVTLGVTHGTISVGSGTGVTVTNNSSASVTLSGSVANINALLAAANAVTYNPTANYNGSDTLTMTTNDGGNTGGGSSLSATSTVDITINSVPDQVVSFSSMTKDTSTGTAHADWNTNDTSGGRLVSGTLSEALAGTQVLNVYANGNLIGAATVNGQSWEITDLTGYSANWTYTAKVVEAGRFGPVATQVVTIDTSADAAPVISTITNAASATVANAGSTTSLLGTISGTGVTGSKVYVYDNTSTNLVGTATVAANGTWSITGLASNLNVGSGSNTFAAKQVDAQGNVSVTSNLYTVTYTENLVTNGTFGPNGLTGWTSIINGSWGPEVYDGNTVAFNSHDEGAGDGIYQNITTIAGKTYTLTMDVSGITSGKSHGFQVDLTDVASSTVVGSKNQVYTNTGGTFTLTFTATGTTTQLKIVNDYVLTTAGSDSALDNIVVTQAATVAANSTLVAAGTMGATTGADAALTYSAGSLDALAGNDTITASGTDIQSKLAAGGLINGGAGVDTLKLAANTTLNLVTLTNNQTVKGLEQVEVFTMQGGSTLTLSANDVLSLGQTNLTGSAASKVQLIVNGTSTDRVSLQKLLSDGVTTNGMAGNTGLAGVWTKEASQVTYNSVTYNVYTHSTTGAQVLVQSSIADANVVTNTYTSITSASAEGAPSSAPSLVITDDQALTVANGATTKFTLTFSGPVAGLTESDIVTTGTLVAGSLTGTGTATVINGVSYYSTYTVQANAPASGVGSFSLQVATGSYTDATNTSVLGKAASTTQGYGDLGNLEDNMILNGASGFNASSWNSSGSTAIFSGGDNSTLTSGRWGSSTNPTSSIQVNWDVDGALYGGAEKIVLSNKAELNLVAGQSYSFDVDFKAIKQTTAASSAKWMLVDASGTKLVDLTSWYTTQSTGSVAGATQLTNGVWTYVNKTYVSTVTGTYYLALAWDVGASTADEMAFDRINFSLSSGGKAIAGTAAAETLTGSSSGDSITVNGADTVIAGAGNDTITVTGTTFASIDGGEGSADTLVLSGTYGTLDLTKPAVAATVKGVEIIDLGVSGSSSANTLIIGVSKVLELASGSAGTTKQLIINGDSSDHLQLSAQYSNGASTGTWTAGSTTTVNSVTYTIYTYSGESNLQLLVQQGVTVDTTAYSIASGDVVAAANTMVTIGDVETAASGGSTGSGDGGSQQAANVNNHTTDTSPLIQGTLTQALVGTQSVKIFRINMTDASTTEVALGSVTVSGTSWSYQDSGLVAGKQYRYIARVMDGSTVLDDSNTYTMNVVSGYTTSSPLVLDLNGDGVHTASVGTGTQFDLTGFGKQSVGWTAGGDGFLVRDLNHDGQINSGAEMFGNNTTLANGAKALNGWEALNALDSNADGVIDTKDSAFADLKVWVDANGDGVTDAGELRTLSDVGVASINVAHLAGRSVENGNVLDGAGSFTKANGSTGSMTDVWFQLAGTPQLDLSKALVKAGVVDLTNGQAQTLKLDLNAVLGTGVTTQLVINGDSSDTVTLTDLTEHWAHQAQAITQNGHTYEVYLAANGAAAQLLIEQHMTLPHIG